MRVTVNITFLSLSKESSLKVEERVMEVKGEEFVRKLLSISF